MNRINKLQDEAHNRYSNECESLVPTIFTECEINQRRCVYMYETTHLLVIFYNIELGRN